MIMGVYYRCVELIDVIRASDPKAAEGFRQRLYELAATAYAAVNQTPVGRDWLLELQRFEAALEKWISISIRLWAHEDFVFDPSCGTGLLLDMALWYAAPSNPEA
jgi:hypothetical protein